VAAVVAAVADSATVAVVVTAAEIGGAAIVSTADPADAKGCSLGYVVSVGAVMRESV